MTGISPNILIANIDGPELDNGGVGFTNLLKVNPLWVYDSWKSGKILNYTDYRPLFRFKIIEYLGEMESNILENKIMYIQASTFGLSTNGLIDLIQSNAGKILKPNIFLSDNILPTTCDYIINNGDYVSGKSIFLSSEKVFYISKGRKMKTNQLPEIWTADQLENYIEITRMNQRKI